MAVQLQLYVQLTITFPTSLCNWSNIQGTLQWHIDCSHRCPIWFYSTHTVWSATGFNGSLVRQKHTAGLRLPIRNADTGLEITCKHWNMKTYLLFSLGFLYPRASCKGLEVREEQPFPRNSDLLKDTEYWIEHLTAPVRLVSSSTGNSGKLTLLLWTRSGEPELADDGKKKTK